MSSPDAINRSNDSESTGEKPSLSSNGSSDESVSNIKSEPEISYLYAGQLMKCNFFTNFIYSFFRTRYLCYDTGHPPTFAHLSWRLYSFAFAVSCTPTVLYSINNSDAPIYAASNPTLFVDYGFGLTLFPSTLAICAINFLKRFLVERLLYTYHQRMQLPASFQFGFPIRLPILAWESLFATNLVLPFIYGVFTGRKVNMMCKLLGFSTNAGIDAVCAALSFTSHLSPNKYFELFDAALFGTFFHIYIMAVDGFWHEHLTDYFDPKLECPAPDIPKYSFMYFWHLFKYGFDFDMRY